MSMHIQYTMTCALNTKLLEIENVQPGSFRLHRGLEGHAYG